MTGTLAAQEEAEVAAEVQGRVVATPVERGTRVAEGDALIRIAAAEMEAQAAEADANAAQIVGRLGLGRRRRISMSTECPKWPMPRANLDLAEGDFERAQMLFERKLLSKAEFDQRTAQVEVARRQYDIARNGALQQYQALLGARARVSLAQEGAGRHGGAIAHSPASWDSGWSRLATTSRAAPRSPRSFAPIRCA